MDERTGGDSKRAILLVDSDRTYGRALAVTLGRGFVLEFNLSGQGALMEIEAGQYDAALVDVDEQGPDQGFELLERMRKLDAGLPILAITQREDVSGALRAGQVGATEYATKAEAHRALEPMLSRHPRRRAAEPERPPAGTHPTGVHFVGGSEEVRRLLADAAMVAAVDSTVLITGEHGTGKEVLARYIHEHSRRAGQAFVTVNCAAIPDGLVESKLFGHERGAFTGAVATTKGSFELADEGTLFLDEITEMPVALQPKLLRALQSGEFSRVGSERTQTADARLICSSNRDMAKVVADGRLRADLYYRINVVHLHVPPLRERRGDIPQLARHFLRRKAAELRKSVDEISPAADALLLAHDWPGNARELENLIERAVVFGRSRVIGSELLSPISPGAAYLSMNWDEARDVALRRFERSYLTALLQVHRGSVSGAAQAMGVSRQAFYKALERTGLNPDRFRPAPSSE